jgi:GT2 family glycosyltransferase
MGMPGNANFAVAHSTHPYIAMLHHDDIYRSDLLEKWAAVLDRHPDVGFVFNPYGVYQSDFIYDHPFKEEKLDGRWFLEKHLFPHWGCPVRGTAMVRRSCWDELGGMRTEFGLLADVDMWMRLARHWSVGYVPEPIITMRQERPDYYPDIYTGKDRFWERQRFLYEIHAMNRLEYYGNRSMAGKYKLWEYKVKLGIETCKWLCYAIVRKKSNMLLTSAEGATPYDPWPLRFFRRVLIMIVSEIQ